MPPRVYIATPSHDHKFHAGYTLSLIKLVQSQLYPLIISKVGGAGVARARNNMAQEFLASTADFYFAIDADITFEPWQVQRCVDACARTGSVVCGLYALKQDKLAWCVNTLPGETVDSATGLQRVASSGTGFMCIPRAVFVAMIEAHPEIAYSEDLSDDRGKTRWDFFSMGVVAGRYLTEDWYFCHRARALGIDILADTSIALKHEGMISFPLADPMASDETSQPASLWPSHFLAAGISPDHCADVLAGCYDVPFTPASPPIVLDLGANVGAFLRWSLKRWPGCKVYSYEPNPDNYRLLEHTADSLLDESWAIHPVAVLDKPGVGQLRFATTNCGAHSLFDTGEVGSDGVTVDVIDAAALPRADILKIDTEGAELPILNRLEVAGRIREFSAIMLEYHSESDRCAIQVMLEKNGFDCVGSTHRCKDRGELKFIRKP